MALVSSPAVTTGNPYLVFVLLILSPYIAFAQYIIFPIPIIYHEHDVAQH